jgi:hypothetical protein
MIPQRLDVDAQLAQIDQAARLPELGEAFVNVAASWVKRPGTPPRLCERWGAGQRTQAGWAALKGGSGSHQPDEIPSASPVSDPTTPSTVSSSRS